MKGKCRPKVFKRVAKKTVSKSGQERAVQQRARRTEDFVERSRFRNGVETLPSIMRRKYGIDHMPVRRLLPTKMLFGLKVGALNIVKFCKYMQDREKCAPNAACA